MQQNNILEYIREQRRDGLYKEFSKDVEMELSLKDTGKADTGRYLQVE